MLALIRAAKASIKLQTKQGAHVERRVQTAAHEQASAPEIGAQKWANKTLAFCLKLRRHLTALLSIAL